MERMDLEGFVLGLEDESHRLFGESIQGHMGFDKFAM